MPPANLYSILSLDVPSSELPLLSSVLSRFPFDPFSGGYSTALSNFTAVTVQNHTQQRRNTPHGICVPLSTLGLGSWEYQTDCEGDRLC